MSDFEYIDEDVGSFPSEEGEDSELECFAQCNTALLEGGDFLQDDPIHIRAGGRQTWGTHFLLGGSITSRVYSQNPQTRVHPSFHQSAKTCNPWEQ